MPIPTLMVTVAAVMMLATIVSSRDTQKKVLVDARDVHFWIPMALVTWSPFVQVVNARTGLGIRGDALLLITAVPIVAIAAWQSVRWYRGTASPRLTGALLALLLVVAGVAAVVTGQSWMHVSLGLVALAMVSIVSRSGAGPALSGIVAATAIAIVAAAVYALAVPGAIRTDCGDNASKCEMFGGFVSIGEQSGSNAFGITLAILAGVVVYRMGSWQGAVAGAAITIATLSTGARLAAVCAAAVVCFATALSATRAMRGPWQRTTLATGLSLVTLASITTAIVPFPASAFTDRATLWMRARDFVEESPWFGHGVSFWVRDAATQPPPPRSYAPHNVWLDQLVAVGFLGTIFVVVVIVLGVMWSRASMRIPALLLIAGLLCVGIFESTVIPLRLGPIPAGFLILVLLLSTAESDHVRPRFQSLIGFRNKATQPPQALPTAAPPPPGETSPASSPE